MPKNLPPSKSSDPHVIGIDVSKESVTLYDTTTGKRWQVANTMDALHQVFPTCAEDALIVCEHTGGYERTVLAVALSCGRAIHRADGQRVKTFIASHGEKAKTDARDAYWIARYGVERYATLPRWQPRNAARDQLADLVRHRADLIDQRAAEKTRRQSPSRDSIKDMIRDHIAFLDQQIADIETRIEACLADEAQLRADEETLKTLPGIGPVVARTLLALIPELGTLNRKQVASLAGLAPHPRQSGQWTGRGRTGSGQSGLRPILFMAALSAARTHPKLKVDYDAFLKAGKPKKVALTAIARKLLTIANAIIRKSQQLT